MTATPTEAAALAAHLQAVWAGGAAPPLPPHLASATEARLEVRRAGGVLFAGWGRGVGLAEAVATLVRQAQAGLAAGGRSMPDAALLTLPGPAQPLGPLDLSRARSDAFRGMFGLELRAGHRRARLTPLEVLAQNLRPASALDRLARDLGLPSPEGATALAFPARSVLIELPAGRGLALYRGQRIVPQAALTRARLTDLRDGMADWLVRSVAADGACAYKYWPSRGTWSTANNSIRQFMASAALARLAGRSHPGAAGAAARNFAHNFTTFYREDGDLGLILEGPKVKLGAAAVALIAILDLPDPAPFARQRDRLAAFILSMQRPNGSFATFLRPEGRDDCQNFYPGEAMLALMRLHAVTGRADALAAVARAYPHYRAFHLARPNPAFVPWQAQALLRLTQATGDPAPRAFARHITRWLIGLQQGADQPADVQGGFFAPDRPDFGPPHASAIGVYMEGIVEVFADARATDDPALAETCRISLLRAARALRQLQFRHGDDMFSIHHRSRVRGAIRTAVHDNTIRVDNVQHGLMALLRIDETFTDADFTM